MPSEIERLLERIHAPTVEVPTADPELERELVARVAALHREGQHGREAQPSFVGWLPRLSPRLAVAVGATLLAIVGACVLPTSYDVPLGLSVQITTDAELPHAEIAEYVRERGEASEVDVFVRRSDHDGEAETQMLIRMWDQNLAVGELEHELREVFPELDDATIVETALEGEIETVWGRRIAHRAFHLSLRQADLEQARAQLLAQLRAQGLTAEQVVVEVRDRPDGRREIKVEIDREAGDGPVPELSLPLDELGPDARWVLDPHADPDR